MPRLRGWIDVGRRASEMIARMRRLDPQTWSGVTWPEGVRIIDLANVPELAEIQGYEGLYW